MEELFDQLSLGKDEIYAALSCTEKIEEIVGHVKTTLILLALTESNLQEFNDSLLSDEPILEKQDGYIDDESEESAPPVSENDYDADNDDEYTCPHCQGTIIYGGIKPVIKHCLVDNCIKESIMNYYYDLIDKT